VFIFVLAIMEKTYVVVSIHYTLARRTAVQLLARDDFTAAVVKDLQRFSMSPPKRKWITLSNEAVVQATWDDKGTSKTQAKRGVEKFDSLDGGKAMVDAGMCVAYNCPFAESVNPNTNMNILVSA
jgi:hypothetical protein